MNSVGDGITSLLNNLYGWAKQPFNETMDLTSWFLFVGLILAFVFSWHLVLRDLKGAA